MHELRHTTLVHNGHLSVVRLSQTDSDSESGSVLRTPGQTCVTVSDPVLSTMRQACNHQVANDCICAAVHKFELEVTSNLKISTLHLKLGSSDCNKYMRWNRLDQGSRFSAEQQSPLTAQHVGDGEARGGGAPGSWRPQPTPSRRAGAMI